MEHFLETSHTWLHIVGGCARKSGGAFTRQVHKKVVQEVCGRMNMKCGGECERYARYVSIIPCIEKYNVFRFKLLRLPQSITFLPR